MPLDETHDPSHSSWVDSANAADTDFPIQNLPYGVFRPGPGEAWRTGVAIGDRILDLARARAGGGLDAAADCEGDSLNGFMSRGPVAWSALRLALSRGLRRGSACESRWRDALVPAAQAELRLPARIGDYTDFYASIHHATTVGRFMRPDNPLMPNYKWIPIAYHGRASTVVASGHAFPRPCGQIKGADFPEPAFGPSRRLDYELELGFYVGPGNAMGSRIAIGDAERHIFGMCLVNDWSARDIQGWEYQPLGPFLGKSFATSVSPWVVTLDALVPFRTPWTRPAADPAPLAYLDDPANRAAGAIDISIEAWLDTQSMRLAGVGPARLTRSSFRHSYWTIAQMIVHHAANGCALNPGDLLATGTQSGPTAAEAGSLLELSEAGRRDIALPMGQVRRFLEDGDRVILRAHCERDGARRIGFGECVGTVLPAT